MQLKGRVIWQLLSTNMKRMCGTCTCRRRTRSSLLLDLWQYLWTGRRLKCLLQVLHECFEVLSNPEGVVSHRAQRCWSRRPFICLSLSLCLLGQRASKLPRQWRWPWNFINVHDPEQVKKFKIYETTIFWDILKFVIDQLYVFTLWRFYAITLLRLNFLTQVFSMRVF